LLVHQETLFWFSQGYDDQIVRLRQSALYPPHVIVEHDVRHGYLPIPVLLLQAAAIGLKHQEPSIAIGSATSRRCLPNPLALHGGTNVAAMSARLNVV
jgi:hypothetical protein